MYSLSLFCCFKKANLPNYDYLDVCLNFICHEGNIIWKSDNLHRFFMHLWDSVPLAIYPSWNERLQKICTCQVWSLSLSALSWQPWNQRATCSAVEKKRWLYLVTFDCIQNEHMWENMEREYFLTLLWTPKARLLFKYHTHCSWFHFFLKKGQNLFAIKVRHGWHGPLSAKANNSNTGSASE